MKPAPTTTDRLIPRSTCALIRSMSSRFRSVKTPARSIPGIGGRDGAAPGARISLSYGSSYSVL